MATLYPAGITGGTSADLDITEAIEEIRIDTPFNNARFGRIRTREIRERRTLTGEIGCTLSALNISSANPIIVDSASWGITEETLMHEASAESTADVFDASKTKPFVKVTAIYVRYKQTEGRFTLRYNTDSDGADVHADFQISESDPYIETGTEHILASEKASCIVTVTIPVGARIRQISERQVMDGMTQSEYEFSFQTFGTDGEGGAGDVARLTTPAHLIDILTPTPDYGFVGDTIAYFNNAQLDAHQYTVSQSLSLNGDGSEEASAEQTITCYQDTDVTH